MNWVDTQFEHLSGLIQPEWHYADIGACVGEMTDLLCPEMKMGHLFEPSPFNYDFLSRKYPFLGKDRLIINHAAVSDHDGITNFSINLNDPAVGSIEGTLPARVRENYFNPDRLRQMGLGDGPASFGGVYYREKIEPVKTITLDTYFKDKRIDFIKVDAEGAEWDIFKGAKEIMSTRSIIFQVEFHWDEDWSRRSILRDLNYNIYTSRELMGGNKAQKAFVEEFFEPHSSSFRKLPHEAPQPYQGIVAKEDEAVIALLE